MVLLSFYLIEEENRRQKRNWLTSIDHTPTDWVELRLMLEEVMQTVYVEHVAWGDIVNSNVTGEKTGAVKEFEAIITLERHLPGKYTMGLHGGGYSQKKIPAQREYEVIFKLVYNPKNGELYVKDAQFGPGLGHIRSDFWRIEREIQWRSPPAIPKEHRDPLDPKGMVMEIPATRYADYNRRPSLHYSVEQEQWRQTYSQPSRPVYDRERRRLYNKEEE